MEAAQSNTPDRQPSSDRTSRAPEFDLTKEFFQAQAELRNQYDADWLLQSYLKRVLPAEVLNEIQPDLQRFGGRVVGDIYNWGEDAEANNPRLVQFDAWGRRIDKIEVSAGWEQLRRVSAEEGLVAIGYERKYGEYSRIYQFAKLMLFNPSSATYMCPLAMTDGAARVLEVYASEDLKQRAFPRVTSRDPDLFWTSGQWMTEKAGGSDVGNSQTVATPLENGKCSLDGKKWFSSATTSEMTMTLARLMSPELVRGSKGLSVFYLETHTGDGKLNGIQIERLKDKLGTKALPTAELTLEGAQAELVGEVGQGVRTIATLFNITRIYNACAAVSLMQRGIVLAQDYAERRMAFGKFLTDQPLHMHTLKEMEVERAAGFHLLFETVGLLGREEVGKATPDELARLRIMTPIIKLFTAKQAVRVLSETLECFGGAGYVENTGLPKLLRNAQVLPIWEGTTNVLSLDVLRAIDKEKALQPLMADIRKRMSLITDGDLAPAAVRVIEGAARIEHFYGCYGSNAVAMQEGARELAMSIAQVAAASLLIEHAYSTGGPHTEVALRWCRRELTPLLYPTNHS